MQSTHMFKNVMQRFGVISLLAFLMAIVVLIGHPSLAYAETPDSSPAAETVAPMEESAARGSCDGQNPATYNPSSVITARSTSLYGRGIELRYHRSSRCAWGRIRNGSPGDEIWTDRSSDGGRNWEPKLGAARINSGYTQKYTVMFNDAGKLMRACGKAGNRKEVACTGWY
jgi:peptidoglycan DL-endopeptidase RipA